MEDIASSTLTQEQLNSAEQLCDRAEEHLDSGNNGTAADLFASAGDKYAAAAEKSSYEFISEDYMRSARHCWRLADQLATQQQQGTPAGDDEREVSGIGDTRNDNRPTDENKTPALDIITEDVEVTLDDYVGREELKETIDRKVFSHAKNPELDEEFGIVPANGFILHGPPGTGKTFFAKCMAGEVDMPFVEIDITEMTSKYVNESPQLIDDIFKQVHEHGPMMVFINELDAVAMSRDGDMTASEKKAIDKLLIEVEKLQDTQTIIVGATNRPGDLGRAIKRSGRFTDEIKVGIPDEDLRRKLIEEFMTDRPLASNWEVEQAVDITEGCTPADLKEICNEAARIARDHYIETNEKGITNAMFNDAFNDILSHS